MKREAYLTLDDNVNVKKVLFELGLLSVKDVDGEELVRLGPPNWTATCYAMELLLQQNHGWRNPRGLGKGVPQQTGV